MLKFLLFLIIITSFYVDANNIRVVTEHLPPYQIVKNGNLVAGSSYLIMKEVLKRAQIQASHEVMPWARAYKIGLDRSNTIIYSLARTPERESLLKWIGQLYRFEYGFFSTKSNENVQIKTAADALKYTAVSVRNSFESNSLQRIGFKVGVNLILVVDYNAAWEMVQKDRADIIYANAAVLEFSNYGQSLFKKQGNVIEVLELYVAANLNTDKKTLDNLSAAFVSVKKDPSFNKLFNSFYDE